MNALVFPGQGSQIAGMAADVHEVSALARDLFAQADEALSACGLPAPLSSLCFEGPDDLLKQTEIAQPALLAASYVLYRVGQAKVGQFALCAGHSLGEYTALVAAGSLDFGTALRLVRRRGELMRDAAAAHPGAMAAVINLDDALVAQLCLDAPGTVVPANYNSPGQVVVSGEPEAVAAVVAAAKAAGGRGLPLKVSGAFHSPLMASAAQAMAAELAGTDIAAANVPVIQNVTGLPTTDSEQLRTGLAQQVTGSVRWTQTVQAMAAAGVSRMVECGPGTVLTGLLKRIDPSVEGANINSLESTV